MQVDVRNDSSERIKYDYEGYYAYIRKGLLSYYPNFAADSHWHDDLEFISVLSGSMNYNVNGEIIHLESGQGIFVNARQIHYGFSNEHQDCEFYCVLLHPMLLCTSQQIDHDFITPIITDESIPYIFLDRDAVWQKQILDYIEIMYDIRKSAAAPLYIQSSLYHIWILLTENAMKVKKKIVKRDRRLSILKDMLSYIHKSYRGKVTLDDIAAAGNVSKSTCLVIFKKYLQDTPINYLIGFRLKQAIKLLRKSDMQITEIALEVGFGGVSYFAETFKKTYGCSPSEYRVKGENQ